MPTPLVQLNTNDIEVFVIDGLVESTKKLLKSTQNLTFKIQMPRMKWEVRRNDNDFNTLHKYLTKVFPHIMIPALSSFKSPKKFDQVFIKKRGRTIEKFLKNSLRCDEIKSNYLFVQFLSSLDKREVENVMKTIEKEVGCQSVKELITHSGEVRFIRF